MCRNVCPRWIHRRRLVQNLPGGLVLSRWSWWTDRMPSWPMESERRCNHLICVHFLRCWYLSFCRFLARYCVSICRLIQRCWIQQLQRLPTVPSRFESQTSSFYGAPFCDRILLYFGPGQNSMSSRNVFNVDRRRYSQYMHILPRWLERMLIQCMQMFVFEQESTARQVGRAALQFAKRALL